MGLDYTSPGGAAVGALDNFLIQREAKKHQDLLDQLAIKRESDDSELRKETLKGLQEDRAARRVESAQKIGLQHLNDIQETLGGMKKGDIPSADFLQDFEKVAPGIAAQQFPKPAESLPGIAAVPAGTVRMGITPSSSPDARPYVGSRQERDKLDQEAKVKEIRDKVATLDPSSPEYRKSVMDYEMLTGKSIPAGFVKAPGADTEPVARQNPRTGVVERLTNGAWSPVTGDVPKGTHFMTEPPPKDTSAKDARDETHRAQVHQQAITELDKWAAPIEGHIQGINDLGIAINERSPQADALIAPLVLKATVSGTGSGFRMTRPEIEGVVGGRSKWETLQATLNQWSLDPKQALKITDEQRTELRSLAKAIRTKANNDHQKIIKARHAIDDANDARGIDKMRTQLHDDLFSSSTDAPDTAPAGPTRIIYDMNGKVVKQ